MGAQSEPRATSFKQRYAEWEDPEVPPFHYGTHYSSSAVVLYYLIRTAPFTQQYRKLQACCVTANCSVYLLYNPRLPAGGQVRYSGSPFLQYRGELELRFQCACILYRWPSFHCNRWTDASIPFVFAMRMPQSVCVVTAWVSIWLAGFDDRRQRAHTRILLPPFLPSQRQSGPCYRPASQRRS